MLDKMDAQEGNRNSDEIGETPGKSNNKRNVVRVVEDDSSNPTGKKSSCC